MPPLIEPENSKTFDFCHSSFTVPYLRTILDEINRTGGVTVKNVNPGSVSLLDLGAFLSEYARTMVGK